MELLLNLFWLLLAMPAYWLWRYSRTAPQRRKFNALQCFLALGCLLVILFPVVSASDDLRAMRAEMEESSSKKSTCQVAGDKHNSWLPIPPRVDSVNWPGTGFRLRSHLCLLPVRLRDPIALLLASSSHSSIAARSCEATTATFFLLHNSCAEPMSRCFRPTGR